jgi:hypothetical protein
MYVIQMPTEPLTELFCPNNLAQQGHKVKKAKSVFTSTIQEIKFFPLERCMTSGLWREVVVLKGHKMSTVL